MTEDLKMQLIPNLSTLNQEELNQKLKNNFLLNPNLETNTNKGNYFLTDDNYIKMNLIFMRCQAGLPAII